MSENQDGSAVRLASHVEITGEAILIEGSAFPWYVVAGSIHVAELQEGTDDGSEKALYGVTFTVYADAVTMPPFTPQTTLRSWDVRSTRAETRD